MPPLHAGQEKVRRSPARFKVLACGRRWGKTQLCAALAFACALQGGIVWWVAPTYDVTKLGWRKIVALSEQIPGVTILKSEHEIHYPGGGMVVMRSADGKRSLRGEGIDLLIVEEAGYIDEQRWTADLRPSLSDKQGQAVFIGSPNGRTWFYRLFQKGRRGEGGYQSWQYTTYDNPFVANSEIDAAREELPDWVFRQEYLAEFVTFEGRVYKSFDPAGPMVFSGALDLDRYEDFYLGIDFGFRNPCAIPVAGMDRDGTLDIIDSVYESGLTGADVVENVRRLSEQYGVLRGWADPSDPGMITELAEFGIEAAPRPPGGLEQSWVKNGIIAVEKRLIAKPPALRIYAPNCPDIVRDFDNYRYPKRRGDETPEKESPLKVDDHGCDAVRYMVVGIEGMTLFTGGVVI